MPSSRRLAWGLGATVVVFVVATAIVVEAPATLLDGRIDAISAGRVRVANATGTLWQGAGDLVLLPASNGEQRIPIRWRIAAAPLLGGQIVGVLDGEGAGAPPTNFTLSQNETSVRNFSLSLPAQTVVLLAAPALSSLLATSGAVDFHLDTLTLTPRAIDGHASCQWRDAIIGTPGSNTRVALGNVAMELTGAAGAVSGTVSNVGGDVTLVGTIVGPPGAIPTVDATIAPRAGIAPDTLNAINASLSLVARPDATGSYHVVWQGSDK